MRDLVEMPLTMNGQIGSFREVLPEQTVCIFIAASLPGASWITEVDVAPDCDAELVVTGHFFAAIPCQGHGQVFRQRLDLLCD